MNPLKPFFDYLDKARSRIYSVFLFWVLVLNGPAIFTSIFVDQELIFKKTGLLKGEYIRDSFYNYSSEALAGYVLLNLAVASMLTWLMIWILPKSLIRLAYQRELKDQYEREGMRLDEEERLNNRKKIVTSEQLQIVKKEQKVASEQESLDRREEAIWQKDFTEFSKTKYYDNFHTLVKCIYEHSGYVKADYDEYGHGGWGFELNPDILAYADSLELIKYRDSGTNIERVEFTNKGKYFVRRYQAMQEGKVSK